MKDTCEQADTATETLKTSQKKHKNGGKEEEPLPFKGGCSGLVTVAIKRPADQNLSINTSESKSVGRNTWKHQESLF